MDVTYSSMAKRSMAIEVEDTLRMVFLQKRCVNCAAVTPSCSPCKADEVCSQIPATCDACAQTSCVKSSYATNTGVSSGGSSGPNVGAIAGGVVGGLIVISLLVFMVYWFGIRGKRQQQDLDQRQWEEEQWEPEKPRSEFSVQRDARSSTHTVTSMASTVLTRASNVIQIAYIPGVTQRNPTSPGVLVPPVPPIPLTLSPDPQNQGHYIQQGHPDTLYFDASEIRDSTYSGLSAMDARGSYARNSMAPSISPSLARTSMAPSISPSLARSSVATTIFRGNAIASPVPALPIMRGKAAVVSVKSSNSSPDQTPEIETPPVPSIDYSKHGSPSPPNLQPKQIKMPGSVDGMSMRSNSIRSTATLGKPMAVNIMRGKPSTISTPSSQSIQEEDAKSSPIPSRSSSPKGLGLHRLTEVSVSSGKTHERANRQSARQSSHTLDDEGSESEGEPHARSRQSLAGHQK